MVSGVFQPAVAIVLFLGVVALAHRRVEPSLYAAFWLAALPGAWLAGGMRLGLFHDPDLGSLAERRIFLPGAALAVAVGAVLSYTPWAVFPVPSYIRMVMTAVAIWLGISAAVSQVWKISLHEGATLGILLLAAVAFGVGAALVLSWTPVLVGWARLRLRKHDAWQLAGGAAVAVFSVWSASLLSR